MKKTFLPVIAIAAFLSVTIASCTKEQTLLGFLYGVWTLDSQLDADGFPISFTTTIPGFSSTTSSTEVTFYNCYDKTEENCYGTTTTTSVTTYVNGDPTDTNIFDDTWSYRVFGKSEITLDGDVYAIDEASKKSLVIHPVSAPKATRTYSKK